MTTFIIVSASGTFSFIFFQLLNSLSHTSNNKYSFQTIIYFVYNTTVNTTDTKGLSWSGDTKLCFLTVTGRPSYAADQCWQSGLLCCCCLYLEKCALTCHVRPHPLCLFSEVASRLSSSGIASHDFHRNICSACAVTVVIVGHLSRSFYLQLDSIMTFELSVNLYFQAITM